jgi:hypothetical protein
MLAAIGKIHDWAMKGEWRRFRLTMLYIIPALLLGAIFGYHHPYILAPDFVWPTGCPKFNYGIGMSIPRNCAINALPNSVPKSYGLPKVGTHPWYRIGNDMIEINCDVRGDICEIKSIERNSYHQ